MQTGLPAISAATFPIRIDGVDYEFRALTMGQWAQALAQRNGERLSAYLEALDGDQPDHKQIEDLLLDCTYPSDFARMRDDQFELIVDLSIGGAAGTGALMLPEHRKSVLSIIHSLNFGSVEEGGPDDATDALEIWINYAGFMAQFFKRGLDPLLLFRMTMAQVGAMGEQMGEGDG